MKDKPLAVSISESGESASSTYRRLFVGEASIGALLRYELVMHLFSGAPGALGFALRSRSYAWLLGECGSKTVFGRGVVLRSPCRISVGASVLVDDLAVLDAKGEGSTLRIGDSALIGRSSILSCSDSVIEIGAYVSMGPFCVLASKADIRIGTKVAIGAGSHIMAGGHVTDDPDIPIMDQARVNKGITIEDGVWIGSGVTVLDGVTVGRNSIVGAGSVVHKDVPECSVVLGNPARVVQSRR